MPFEREQKFYDQHKAELLRHHLGKFVLIVGEELIGAYDEQEAAYRVGIERFGNVPLFIKLVEAQDPTVSLPALTLGLIGART
jgi:hypothetical protein